MGLHPHPETLAPGCRAMPPVAEAVAADIAIIHAGWDCDRSIVTRAVSIRKLLSWGQDDAAEALAREIDALQSAYAEARGLPDRTDGEWTIGLAAWADMVIGGAFLRSRHFTSIWAFDGDSALAEAIRRYRDPANPHQPQITVSRRRTARGAAA